MVDSYRISKKSSDMGMLIGLVKLNEPGSNGQYLTERFDSLQHKWHDTQSLTVLSIITSLLRTFLCLSRF